MGSALSFHILYVTVFQGISGVREVSQPYPSSFCCFMLLR